MRTVRNNVGMLCGLLGVLMSLTSQACVTFDSLLTQSVPPEKLINVNGNLTLCPMEGIIHGTRFKIRASNIVLDCGGNTFDGEIVQKQGLATRALDSMEALENVVIKNCNFRNYQRGLVLSPSTLRISNLDYSTGLKRFTISNVTVENIRGSDPGDGVGIVVGPYSKDFTIKNSIVRNTMLTGIYLEAYSIRTKIVNSEFVHNGFSGGPGGGREAIAIDASSGNIISGNTFTDNKYAAITTYKNCGEKSTYRNMHANNNTIDGNVFKYHDNHGAGAAIIIASRQTKTIPAEPDECIDETIDGYDDKYFDYSKYNIIRYNSFINNVTSIKIMDSFQTVLGNTFHGTTWRDLDESSQTHTVVYDIAIGNAILADLNSPVIGVSILNNISRTTTTNASGRTFVPNHSSVAHFSGNTDAYYRCLPDRKAPGNTCGEILAISNKCEISATSCPARSSYPNAQEFPTRWLDTTYGSNINQSICEARARDLWLWCKSKSSEAHSVTSRFVKNNFVLKTTTYDGP